MMGRVKVKGNIMLLQKLNGLWGEFQKLGRTPELPLIVDIMLDDVSYSDCIFQFGSIFRF